MKKKSNSIRENPLLFPRFLIKNKARSIWIFALYLLIDLALSYYISVFVNKSGILGTMVFMAAALCSALFVKKTLASVKELIYHPVKKRLQISKIIVLAFIGIYTAFALSGRILFFNIGSKANILSLINFILVILLTVPMSLGAIVLIKYISSKTKGLSEDFSIRKKRMLFAIIFGLITLAGTLALIAYYPAITNADTSAQFMQAKGVTQMSEKYSVFMTLMIGAALNIADSPAILAVMQILFLAYVVSRAAVTLYENGLGFIHCVIAAAVFILIPSNFIMTVTLSDAVVHGITILWATVLLYDIVRNRNKIMSSKIFMAEIIACMILVYITGKTGFILFALIAAAILLVHRFKVQSLNVVFIAAAVAFFISGTFLNSDDIQEMPPGVGYMGLGHDIVSVGELGGKLPEGGRYFSEHLITKKQYEFSVYNNNYAEPEDIYLTNKPMLFIRAYAKTFITNPKIMAQAILNRNAPLYSIITPETLSDAGYSGQAHDEFWDANYVRRKEGVLARTLDAIVGFSARNVFLNNMFWNSGIYIWLIAILAAAFILWDNKKNLILLIPAAGYILVLVFMNCWNDFVLYWPINIAACFILAAAIAPGMHYDEDKNHA